MRRFKPMLRCSLPVLLGVLWINAEGAPPSVEVSGDGRGAPAMKDIYAKDFLIGAALDFRGLSDFSPKELALIRSQFSVLTPENSMKPQIQPGPGQWNWTTADALVNFCQENKIKVHGHTLAWHAQTPNWFFIGDSGQPVTRDVAIARLKEHIQTVVGHYKGKVLSWDVVNEAINDRGPDDTENLRNSPWIRAIGPDYITMAFQFAHEADPDAMLFYNDYSIERGGKHQSSLILLKRLIREGAPINGVGIQGHWSLANTPFEEIDQAIADYKALGLKVAISELDVTISGQGGGQLNQPRGPAGGPPRDNPSEGPATRPATTRPAFGRGRGRGPTVPPTPEQLQTQAEIYGKLFQIFQKHKDVVTRVTFWGLNDRRSWRGGQSPLPFDAESNSKPALHAIEAAKIRE
jgi:GH35 family endo-1,4-beta-xylanase